MYGMILIEPEGGLRPAKEFYVMQGELYTDGSATGHRSFDISGMSSGRSPTDVVLNGSRMALANNPMKVSVGDDVRVFFGVGGPNLTSSFREIGGVWDRVYPEGATDRSPHRDAQIAAVPPGGSAMVEFKARVPAKYIFVDRAFSRFAKGNAAIMIAEGDEQPHIFRTGKLDQRQEAEAARSMVSVPAPVAPVAWAVDIHQSPTAVGVPVGKRGPSTLKFALEAIEQEGILDPIKKTTFTYWTYNGKVPGPMLRARVGDTIEVTLKNNKSSTGTHNIDLGGVWGQGGGAAATVVAPGEEKSFVFKAMNPGLYVYHDATPIIPQRISSGMYGMILIEPEGGLPRVDKEFYVMQGDIYTDAAATGHRSFDIHSLLAERPTDVVMNGSRMALAYDPMRVKVGDNVRIFFGVGGPNLPSSFRATDTVWDKVWNTGISGAPLLNVQTAVVHPGGSAMVEFKARVQELVPVEN